MPELPEVETVRAGLDAHIRGARIVDVDVRRESCVRLTPGGTDHFRALVVNRRIDAVVRRGKFLWMLLGDEDDAPVTEALSAHLGMSGQFRVHGDPRHEAHPHCRARVHLELAGRSMTLDFIDQRTFGYLHAEDLVDTDDGLPGGDGSPVQRVPVTARHIARDALDPNLDQANAVRALRTGARGVKQVLLDQTVVSGVGNIYADEALWLSRIHPRQPAHTLTVRRARSLLAATREVMTAALAQGGTSFDPLYVNVNGESGYFSRALSVYGRAGLPCPRCGSPITRQTIQGRSAHWCPRCQRLR